MDSAGNMRGTFSVLKSLIEKSVMLLSMCSTVSSHRFTLIIEKSIEICPQIRDFFNILEELYRLFNSGHTRHDVC